MQNKLLIKNYTASAAITKRRAVRLATNGATQADASTDFISAPELNAESGDRVDVIQQGITQAESGAAIVLGAFLTADSSGRMITATTGQRVIAMALEAASLASDIISVQIIHTKF